MNKILGNGEIGLTISRENVIGVGGLETWQTEAIFSNALKPDFMGRTSGLKAIDKIAEDWVEQLSSKDIKKILKQGSLFGIKIPKEWIKVWRTIIKEPDLRDPSGILEEGGALDSYLYHWRFEISQEFETFFNEMERKIIEMANSNIPYIDIGNQLYKEYGEEFWKKRKESSTTTASQIVNNFLYVALPTKAAKQNLYRLVVKRYSKETQLKKE